MNAFWFKKNWKKLWVGLFLASAIAISVISLIFVPRPEKVSPSSYYLAVVTFSVFLALVFCGYLWIEKKFFEKIIRPIQQRHWQNLRGKDLPGNPRR